MRSSRLLCFVVLVACGAKHTGDGPDASGGGDAIGGERRARRNAWTRRFKCVNGVFQTTDTCTNACVPSLGGCVGLRSDRGLARRAFEVATVVACNADGLVRRARDVRAATTRMCMAGTCSDVCTADGVDLVYVVDEQNDFMSFDPRKLPGNPFTTDRRAHLPDAWIRTIQVPRPAQSSSAVCDGRRSQRHRVGRVHEQRDLQRVADHDVVHG